MLNGTQRNYLKKKPTLLFKKKQNDFVIKSTGTLTVDDNGNVVITSSPPIRISS